MKHEIRSRRVVLLAVAVAVLVVLSSLSTNWGTALGQTGGPTKPEAPEIVPPTPVGSLEEQPTAVPTQVATAVVTVNVPPEAPPAVSPTSLPALLPVTGEYLRSNPAQAVAIGMAGIILLAAGLAGRRRWGNSKNL